MSMTSRLHARTTLPAALALGVVCGALATAVALSVTDFLGTPEATDRTVLPPAENPLDSYVCAQAETKVVVMGGRDDAFAVTDAETTADMPAVMASYLARELSAGTIAPDRAYDDPRADALLLDRFLLPGRTAHGILAMRVEELADVLNDGFSVGDMLNRDTERSHYHVKIKALGDTTPWVRDGDIVHAPLGQLRFVGSNTLDGTPLPKPYDDLLAFIRSAGPQADKVVDVAILDDTRVDFIGFAACTEPETPSGMTFHVYADAPVAGVTHLSCADPKGDARCNPYSGDVPCSTELPLACFNDRGETAPDALSEAASNYWSGGAVAFTEAVRGDRFADRASAQDFCRARFGPRWRMLDYQDGATYRDVIAQSADTNGAAGGVSRAWVDARLEPYGSCWPRDADYGAAPEALR